MKNALMMIISALLLLVATTGCTENMIARGYGGTMNQEIPCDTRLVVATWKAGDLWYMLRKLEPGETPRRYTFVESSSWGAMEGEVRFQERRCNKK